MEDRAYVSLTDVLKREFQQGSFVYMESLVKAAGALPSFKSGHSSRVTRLKISPCSPYIQMRPAEIPFSIHLLKIQEPCPPFQMVSLFLFNQNIHMIDFS